MHTPLLNKMLYRHFKCFLMRAFTTLHPGRDFIYNWHIDVMAKSLHQLEEGNISRLIINIPPRSLKSIMISVAWPAWLLGHNPATKIIVASYSQALSIKHAQDTKVIMESPWYRRLFPHASIAKGKNSQRKFITTMQGFRLATSVGATMTGEGADIIIVDDPHTPQQAMSPKWRQRVLDWYEQALVTRLNDRNLGKIVVVMQRLHRDDLSGYLLGKGTYPHLVLPLYNEQEQLVRVGLIEYCRPADHLLYQNISMHDVQQLQQELGAYAFAAQYQQRPHLLERGLIKNDWIKRYVNTPKLDDALIYQSWDCAIKVGISNDYSVCTTWAVVNGCYYLLDVLRARLEYIDLKQTSWRHYERYQPCAVLIEDKASGQQLLQDLQQESMPAIAIRPRGDKVTRVLAVVALFEAGKVWLPRFSNWLAEYETELFTFPYAAHDDQLDSTTQFLNWINKQQADISKTQIRWL